MDGRREEEELAISLEPGWSEQNDTYKKWEVELLGNCAPATDYGLSSRKTLSYA